MPTTTNFGWTTPADTDLVKDGALAIRTLAGGIDTSMVGLKGGTTGQILSKTSNTDMAFTWITNDQGDITGVTAGTGISGGGTSGTVTITNSMATEITAAGDIIVGTGSGTFDNLPIGTTGQILTADTTVSPYKVKWAAAAASTPSFVGCVAYKTTTSQSAATATEVKVSFNAEEFDTDSFHDNSTNNTRITIPSGKGGKYLFIANLSWTSNNTGIRQIYFMKNGTTVIFGNVILSASSSDSTNICASGIADLTAGDYVELCAYQTSGGSLNIAAIQNATRIQVQYLGA